VDAFLEQTHVALVDLVGLSLLSRIEQKHFGLLLLEFENWVSFLQKIQNGIPLDDVLES